MEKIFLNSSLNFTGYLSNLEKLTIASNQLITLPTSIGRLESLKYLSIAENNLDEIPADIGR